MEIYNNSRNPVLPLNLHIPDSEAHVMPDGKLYIYGSLDDNPNFYCSENYRVISTSDMREWLIHDTSFCADDVPWLNSDDTKRYPEEMDWSNPSPFLQKLIASAPHDVDFDNMRKDLLFAPDAAHKEGKYYLCFCMPDNTEGVAVSDKPEGPFENPVLLPCGGIDPAIFIDDDGQAYYYWGQISANGVKLNDDMISFDRNNIVNNLVTEQEHFFHEGFSMRKHNGLYYAVYSNIERGKPTSLGYATSASPLGPFTYRGIIIDNAGCDPQSWNNHGSIENFAGRWYVFYHRSSRGSQYYRRLCIEPIVINEDGSIDEVKMTSQGAGLPFALGETVNAYHACALSGSIHLLPDETGEVLTGISDGDTAVFRYIELTTPASNLSIQANGKARVTVFLNDIAVIECGNSGTYPVDIACGKYEVKLCFESPQDFLLKSFVIA